MAEKHALNVQARIDHKARKRAHAYQQEYNNIAAHTHTLRGGATAQQAVIAARHHFSTIHGAHHLPN